MDWWYVRAYPGRAAAMDDAVGALVPWLSDVAEREGAERWFFTRYWDMSGHHLRLRLCMPAETADRVHRRLTEVVDLLNQIPQRHASQRLIPGATLHELDGGKRASVCLYAPELAKYGGPRGVSRAEELFTTASRWVADNRLTSLDQPTSRAALAVAYMRTLIPAVLPGEAAKSFWAAHRRQWGGQLRMVTRRQEDLPLLLTRIAAGIGGNAWHAHLRRGLAEHVAAVAATLRSTEADRNPVPRSTLLLHYLHMDMNRWGFLPAEECALGIIASHS
jgi:thiopeptide-type bacteriocin biosynthesis protein